MREILIRRGDDRQLGFSMLVSADPLEAIDRRRRGLQNLAYNIRRLVTLETGERRVCPADTVAVWSPGGWTEDMTHRPGRAETSESMCHRSTSLAVLPRFASSKRKALLAAHLLDVPGGR